MQTSERISAMGNCYKTHKYEGVEKATEPIYKKNSGVGKGSTERDSIIKSHKTLEIPCTVHLRYLSTDQTNMLQKLPEEYPHLLKEEHTAFINQHNRRRWIDIIANILYCILNIVFILVLYSFSILYILGYIWEREVTSDEDQGESWPDGLGHPISSLLGRKKKQA